MLPTYQALLAKRALRILVFSGLYDGMEPHLGTECAASGLLSVCLTWQGLVRIVGCHTLTGADLAGSGWSSST